MPAPLDERRDEPVQPEPTTGEVTGVDESVEMGDVNVEMAHDVVTAEPEPPRVVATRQAADALAMQFGPLLDDDYVSGKTLFRDALCARFDLSLLESEELCDSLEQAGRIRFVSTEEGSGWHVHTPSEEEDERAR